MKTDARAAQSPPDMSQAEAYTLYHTHGGALDAKARSQLDHLLTAMDYPEQLVANVRAEVGDRLYFPAVRALGALLAREAAGAAPCPPPELPTTYHTRENRARAAVAERAAAGRAWRELVEQAKQPAKIAVEEEIDA